MTKEEKEQERLFWETTNTVCNKCGKQCKQSSKVKIMHCPKRTSTELQDEFE